jgi:hypothetical protein
MDDSNAREWSTISDGLAEGRCVIDVKIQPREISQDELKTRVDGDV